MEGRGIMDLGHSGHDIEVLHEGWKALAGEFGWTYNILCEVDGYEVPVLENESFSSGGSDGLYLSAGVHGDECAPPWALLQWARETLRSGGLREPCLIFPCLNPHGFVNNERVDGEGRDLNRRFQDSEHPLIRAWQTYLSGKKFSMALSLHEDYDSLGVYLYELVRSDSIGDQLLSESENVIPRELAEEVDGSEFENGLLSHTGDINAIVEEQLDGGYPEAIYLFQHFSQNSFTFETPSEAGLGLRIASQKRFLVSAYSAFQRGDVS